MQLIQMWGNVNSQEIDFYFNKAAAQCWTELTPLKVKIDNCARKKVRTVKKENKYLI